MAIVTDILLENAIRIEDYLINANKDNRNRVSTDMLPILRSFCEASMYLIYDVETKSDLFQTQDNLKKVRDFIKTKYKNLNDFHKKLDAGPGHSFVSAKNSEALVLSYIPYLIELRELLRKICNVSVLKSIENYPLDLDISLISFYKEIIQAIKSAQKDTVQLSRNLYFIRKKSFKMIGGKRFYEYVMDSSDDENNKFNTFVAYSFNDIKFTYDLRFKLSRKSIQFLDTNIVVNVIIDYEYFIRPCCFNNLLKLLNYRKSCPRRNAQYFKLMELIKSNNLSLLEIIEEYSNIQESKDYYIDFIKVCKDFLSNNSLGHNLIKYLLLTMRNDTIKAQLTFNEKSNSKFDNLCICSGSLAFELMPYAFNPKQAKVPRNLLNLIVKVDCQEELFYSDIVEYIKDKNALFVKAQEIGYSEKDAIELYNKFNHKLEETNNFYLDHKIIYIYGHFTIESYLNETIKIFECVEKKEKSNLILNKSTNELLSQEQLHIINSCFSSSRINFICGIAGSGKTSIIKEIIKNNKNISILCLTTTNTALNNIKVECDNVTYANISEFLKNKSLNTNDFDLIIMDEASFVSTTEAYKIIKTHYFSSSFLIVGDTEQIESIEFGNWFKLCIEKYGNSDFVFKLDKSFRTNSDGLKSIFKNVREDQCSKILELLNGFNMSSKLSNDVFNIEENGVVLCLNYDGLYGINNINRYLQAKNNHKEVIYQQNIYKENDPVIFVVNNFKEYGIYNNLKGIIKSIKEDENEIKFSIYTDAALSCEGRINGEITVHRLEHGTLIDIVKVKDYSDKDETDINLKTKLPFQVSYAMSIHKAQGLEFNKVKIIITKESDEHITKNIFYTAITRAKNKLMIYWEPEVANELVKNLKDEMKSCKKDITLISKYREENE